MLGALVLPACREASISGGESRDTPNAEAVPEPAPLPSPPPNTEPEAASADTASRIADTPSRLDADTPPADVAEPPADAERTPSGLASKLLAPGSGDAHPAPRDRVKVRYAGWTKQGVRFSVMAFDPLEFALDRAIAGWVEGLQLMVAGERRRFWMPTHLAYGDRPAPGLPAGPLTFDIELVDFTLAAPTPADLGGPPGDAQTTKSGLRYEILNQGNGSERPRPNSTVILRYTGWTRDGQVFESSGPRGEPFRLSQVIPGWREGILQMVPGERRMLWIPAKLAYGTQPLAAVVERRARTQPSIYPGESYWIADDLACRFWIPGNRYACSQQVEPSKTPLGAVVFDIELIAIREPPKTFVTAANKRPAPQSRATPEDIDTAVNDVD
jgi:FKBP-type peptidyl-prolyl cis-trans isomerase